MTVHRRRETGQARHHRVVVDAGLPRRVASSGVAKHMTAQNQAHAVARQILVDLDEFIRDLVAFSWVDPVNGSGWTLQWDRARQALETQLGVQTTAVGPIAESADVIPVYEDLIRKGNKMIFATAFGYQPFTTTEAKKHPDVKFIGIGPNTQAPLDNVSTVYGNLWEARYATGVAAGLVTKSGKIGFVAAHTIPSVVAGINGFALGVQMVNPKAIVKVTVTNTWYDPPTETTAANSLIQAGADVTAQHEDSTAPLLSSP